MPATSKNKGLAPSGGAQIRQPLYEPRALGKLSQAESEVAAKRARLQGVEEDVLLKAAIAYLDLVRADTVARSNEQHVHALEEDLASTKRRLAAGELRPIDVSEVQSRLAAPMRSGSRRRAPWPPPGRLMRRR